MSEVQDVIDAIDSGDLKKLGELLETENVNITKLYLWRNEIDMSILGYAVFYANDKAPREEVVAFLIEKKNPDLTLPAEYSYDNLLQQISSYYGGVSDKMFRILCIAHIVNGITISDTFLPYSLDWPLVQHCYNRLKSEARVMDFDWYKRQTFRRPDEKDNGKLKYSKECHLAWAIAYLLRHYGGMKNLTKWGIAHAIALMNESPQMGIERALGRTPPPRFALLKY